jgi:hypothetical protein
MSCPSPGFFSTTRASSWEECLIAGNGRVGALVYGDPVNEVVTLSHERLFLPLTAPVPPVQMTAVLDEVRAHLLAGRFEEAAALPVRLADEAGYGGFRWTDPFVPAFDLHIAQPSRGAVKDYRRGVHFDTGVVEVTWSDDRGSFSRNLFVSRPDDVVVARIMGATPGTVNCTVAVSPTPPSPGTPAEAAYRAGIREFLVGREGSMLTVEARFAHSWGRSATGYRAIARVEGQGGRAQIEPGGMAVTGADGVVVMVLLEVLTDRTAPSFAELSARLAALDANYTLLVERHGRAHAELFGRARLDLGSTAISGASSEHWLAGARSAPEPALVQMEFDAGRHAIISSVGELPPNLQGVWTGTYAPPWSGDYTMNGNVQCALAGLLSTRTPELLLPYFDYLESMLDDFRANARDLFGCRGIFLPARASTHGLANHFSERYPHEFWTAGAGWAARLYFDYWQYTGERDFLLRRALPFMEEAASFYQDFLIPGPDGRMLFIPSLSPENTPTGSPSQAAVNATMDIAVAKELFRNLLDVGTVAPVPDDKLQAWRELLGKLPAYLVAADGALAEWEWSGLRNNDAHRHASHLYPLFYEPDPEIASDPRLRRAAQTAIEARLRWRQSSDPEGCMAFGLVQLGMSAAHLGLAELAYQVLTQLATRYWRPSLVSTHDAGCIFNVDLCGGFPALVAEMLVQSSRSAVHLLPALPGAWPSGSIDGVACRGQVTVERLRWEPRQLLAVLRSDRPMSLRVTLPGLASGIQVDSRLVQAEHSGDRGEIVLELVSARAATLTAFL